MENNLDFKVVINNKSEYESLYTWSINEVGEDGDKVKQNPFLKRDYVPFHWSSYFLTKKLTYQSTFKLEKPLDGFFDEITDKTFQKKRGSKNKDDEVSDHHDHDKYNKNEQEVIFGDMVPDNRRSFTDYSVFGTNRTIGSFDLLIYGVNEGEETCHCWGSPSYTTEVDFRDMTTDDSFQVVVSVSHNRFKELKDSITNKSLSSLQVILGGVKGFYSPWSPGISSSTIKILTTRQPVEIPEDFDLEIPKLGIVNEIELIPNLTQELVILEENEDYEDDEDYDDKPTYTTGEYLQKQTLDEIHSLKTIFEKLIKPLWILVGLMGVLVLLFL